MSHQSDYIFKRVNKWVFNQARQAAPFYIVVMLVTLFMLAYAEPVQAIIAAVVGLTIVGWRDIEVVARGSPADEFFRVMDTESLNETCKYYSAVMAEKGIPEVAYQLDISILRYHYAQRDLPWTYHYLTMMNARAGMQITINKGQDDSEDLQQSELPAMPEGENVSGSEGNSI